MNNYINQYYHLSNRFKSKDQIHFNNQNFNNNFVETRYNYDASNLEQTYNNLINNKIKSSIYLTFILILILSIISILLFYVNNKYN